MKRSGMTVVELLTVIGIIALLIQLLLPAVQTARDSARRTQCQSNLHQLAVAAAMHHDTHGHYPTGGWDYHWVGDPDRGFGQKQPGGWAFNILPFIEQTTVRDMGVGKTGLNRSKAIVEMSKTPVPTFVCPSRRRVATWPLAYHPDLLFTNDEERLPILEMARSDYAMNSGDTEDHPTGRAPKTLAEADGSDFGWYDTSRLTGICYGRSQVKYRDVTDGLSVTYLIAEKKVPVEDYENGQYPQDNIGLYCGYDNDNHRSTKLAPLSDGIRFKDFQSTFGGPHPSGFEAAFCDGSVRHISYTIDAEVHRANGNRQDDKTE